MRIPVTMCHGTSEQSADQAITPEHFDWLMHIAVEMSFESIGYDKLAAWQAGQAALPERPIMIDFDHAVSSTRHEVFEVLERHGFKGNLFICTGHMGKAGIMSWDEVGELM